MTKVMQLELCKSPQILETIRNALLGNSGAWGKLIHEKT
jgi:hypothetical protein